MMVTVIIVTVADLETQADATNLYPDNRSIDGTCRHEDGPRQAKRDDGAFQNILHFHSFAEAAKTRGT